MRVAPGRQAEPEPMQLEPEQPVPAPLALAPLVALERVRAALEPQAARAAQEEASVTP